MGTMIFPGRYVQSPSALKRLGEEVKRFGKKAFFICGGFFYRNILKEYRDVIEKSIEIETELFGGECCDEEIERLVDIANKSGCEMIVGAGGGKTLDTAKAVAHIMELPVGIIPTIASTDAPCSAIAVVYTKEGTFKRYMRLLRNPDLVLVDTTVIAKAPVRFFVSGMGDALATWFEAESCMINHAPNMSGDVGTQSAYSLAKLCYDTLLEYGIPAKLACENSVVTPALEHIVEANVLLSGLGFESGGLAAAHAIHNGLTVLEETHNTYHGEKVAFGTLASLFLTDRPFRIIDEVYNFCLEVGLPVTFKDIGIDEPTDKKLMKVSEAACAEGETIHNEPKKIIPEDVFAALKLADAEGRKRKGL